MGDHAFAALHNFVAPEFVFGQGSRKLAPRYAQGLDAQRVLLVTDPGLIQAGWASEVELQLRDAGLQVSVFSDVSPNPRDHEVMKGAELFASARCQVLVCVGGGSVIDCAKGIGVVSANGRDILEYEGIDRIPVPSPPLICVPTTSGTSADVSQFAIIADLKRRVKIAIISKAVVPMVSLIDPETQVTKDPYLTACTGMDALVHAIEAFVSPMHTPITDMHALQAIQLIRESLIKVMLDPQSLLYREKMMLASLHAGLAFSNTSLGAVHAMSHSLGGYLDLPHGECNALLLERVIDFNFEAEEDRYLKIGESLGVEVGGMTRQARRRALLGAVRELRRSVGIEGGLGDRQVHPSDVPELAMKAAKDPCMATNPRAANAKDLEVVFEEAL